MQSRSGRSERAQRWQRSALLAALLWTIPSSGQETARPEALSSRQAPTDVFEDATEVVVRDVLVEYVRAPSAKTARSLLIAGAGPKALRKRDLELAVEGRRLSLVDVQGKPSELPLPGDEAWRIVLYFDQRLPPSVEIRWAASLLAGQLETMTALGRVEVWLAGEEPRQTVAATRDVAVLDQQLSQLAFFGEAEDELSSLRYSALSGAVSSRETSPGQAARMAEIERGLVVERQDLLLMALDEPSPGVRKALFLVGANSGLAPEIYYQGRLEARAEDVIVETDEPEPARGLLARDSELLARSLAAEGWSVFPLVPPPPAEGELRRGLRLGKLRFRGMVIEHERDRRPERARAYLELGDALMAGHNYAEAEDAYRSAAFHFFSDRRTAAEQATAVVKLAEAIRRQGRAQDARRALEVAVDLDPAVADSVEGGVGWFVEEPERFAALFEAAAAGITVDDPKSLGRAVESLSSRSRVSYQLERPLPWGVPQRLQVLYEGDAEKLRHIGWIARGTTDRRAEARARGLWRSSRFSGRTSGGPSGGSFGELEVFVQPAAGPAVESNDLGQSNDLVVSWRGRFSSDGDPMRVTWVIPKRSSASGAGALAQDLVEPPEVGHVRAAASDPPVLLALPAQRSSSRILIVVEHLASGRWGARQL